MKPEIKKMKPLRRAPRGQGGKIRQTKYRFNELNVGEGWEIEDTLGKFTKGAYPVSVMLNRIRANANSYSRRNGILLSVARIERDGKLFIAVRRDA